MPKTFIFASGQLLTLKYKQIARIPYLTALVSSANNFKTIYNEHGHLKIDSHIDFEDFSFAIESLSFQSIRQTFTHLPKHRNIIRIIALLDFLGLLSQTDTTFAEIDYTFFTAHLPCNLRLCSDEEIVRPHTLQDMAVRFGIAIVKENYDLNQCEVNDQIYWFIMFVLCAPKFFGHRLRYHIYKIAQNSFSLYNIVSLKRLEKLVRNTEKNTRELLSTETINDLHPDEEIGDFWQMSTNHFYFSWFFHSTRNRRTRWKLPTQQGKIQRRERPMVWFRWVNTPRKYINVYHTSCAID
ncbi:unnamed protein product [Adineta ricciae]|uniref:WW domain-containing protein n=1 Tax=Adineta ricciae TaxID=249248 RepID=A0A815NW99_ADIRI|nr:unnamed protein product [Adineta ricciae]